MKSIKFKSNGMNLAGNLFYPENFDKSNQLFSAIVIAHPGGGVKEQTAGLYGKN